MKLTWLGHSSIKLEAGSKVVYIDPYSGDESWYSPADIVLVSEWHFDHCSLPLLKKISDDDTVVLSTSEVASQLFPCATLHSEETRVFDGVNITGMPVSASHARFRRHEHAPREKLGFLIRAEEKTVYFMGDSEFLEGMERIVPDVLLIPVGGTYTHSPDEAASITRSITPKLAIPIQWGSVEGTRDNAELFRERVEAQNIAVRVLEPGEVVSL